MNNVYAAIALSGGTAGALDGIDGTGLVDKDIAMVAVQGGLVYHYILNATSAATEAVPNIIAPDANGGNKRWILTKTSGGHRAVIALGAAAVNNNAVANTLQDATDFSFPVLAGVNYRFHFHICFTSASTSTGARWVLNGPTATNYAVTYNHPTAATTSIAANATDYATPSASAASSTLTGIVIIDGFILPSADGTVQLQFASEVANSAITILAGSTIEVW